jgi:hypothetical protein
VDDSVAVEILNSRTDLLDVTLNFKFVQSFATSEKFIQRLVLAQFQKNVNIFNIFKEMFEPDNIVVMKTAMNLDFRHKLLLCAALGE